jgi:apolipoprotein D and lipocalin family protein
LKKVSYAYTFPVQSRVAHFSAYLKGVTMKKFLTWVAGMSISGSSFAAGLFPAVVSDLDLNQYLGRWYEVASTKPFFQRDCVCVTADYSLVDAETVKVVNSCRKLEPEGVLDVVEGDAKATGNPAKFNVSFGGFRLPFSNYWVVDLADDYRYAVVSTAFRNPIWILSRTPELASEDLDAIYKNLDDAGFNVNSLSPTRQAECSYESF